MHSRFRWALGLAFLATADFSCVALRAHSPAGPAGATVLAPMRVEGAPVPEENKIIGTYGQPEWTARRRFVMSSVYVQPDEQAEVEFGYEFSRDSRLAAERRLTQELEWGLPHRLQLSVEHAHVRAADAAGHTAWRPDSLAADFRYALANWGRLPLNPAVGAGWKFRPREAGSPRWQAVLADELSPNWHWGVNLETERQRGTQGRRETAASGGLSYTLLNEKLNLGLEAKQARTSKVVAGARRAQDQFTIGPSLQWRPIDEIHLDIVPMRNASSAGPRYQAYVFFGFEFGDGADDGDDKRKVEPASTRGR